MTIVIILKNILKREWKLPKALSPKIKLNLFCKKSQPFQKCENFHFLTNLFTHNIFQKASSLHGGRSTDS